MSLLVPNDFNGGEQNIADISNIGTQQNLQVFIDEFEPVFFRKLLGTDLANDFIVGIELEPIPKKWIDLSNTLKPMVKCYVYYWFIRNKVTLTSGTGEVKPQNENSIIVTGTNKMVKAWNKMVDNVHLFEPDTTIYTNYKKCYTEIYKPINGFNI